MRKLKRGTVSQSVRRCLSIVVLAGIAIGCSDATSPASARAQLDANQAKWVSASQPEYAFTLQQSCFCAFVEPIRVIVRNDTVLTATTISNNASIDARYVQTIRGMFDFIDRAIASNAAVLHVTYDAQLGYPTQIVYDGSLTIADDEVTYTVKDVALALPIDDRTPF
jgi:hypothetical protein